MHASSSHAIEDEPKASEDCPLPAETSPNEDIESNTPKYQR